MESIKINNTEIKKGYCTGHKAIIENKDFPYLVMCSPSQFYSDEYTENKKEGTRSKDYGVSLTDDEIINFLDKCITWEIKGNMLFIETEKYNIKIEVQ